MLPVESFVDELEKIAWSWKGFREGVVDEGIPLGGATIGAALGYRNPLRGAALGYAAGSAASMGREYLKPKAERKQAPLSRKVLALSGMGYGVGGLAHGGLQRLAQRPGAARALKATFAHGVPSRLKTFAEEGLPATGAVLGTGIAMGSHDQKPKKPKVASIQKKAVFDVKKPVGALWNQVQKNVGKIGMTGHVGKVQSLDKSQILARARSRPKGMAGITGAAQHAEDFARAFA